MSRTVDERVVEMRFDNRDFERNCSTSMSTLAKLKQSLNLSGASKGLENVSASAKNVNMSGLSSAVDTVRARFSALEVIGVTALANITNSAVNTGKRMLSALTIDPIKTGFQEYETQINAVQTILANTESKGTTLNDVNKALDTLNTYADKTIYNFTEMTRNIGTFTAAGVDLDTSVKSIQGIANLAAVSGSTSQQASTAMYQLSQALAAGRVSLMDWNSVVNAGMGGQVFQDALIRTSEAMGTGAKAAIDQYGSFRESLTKGEWLTTDVLTKTLEQFTMAAEEGSEEWKKFKKSLMDDGYTEKQAEEILKMANTATNAATKVKTFTQLWDTLKEAAQSGWTQTWELIVGDFEEAKEMLTNVSNVLNDIIGKSAEARNKLIKGWKDAGGRSDLLDGIKNAFTGVMNIVKPIKEAFSDIFPKVTVDRLVSFTKGFKDLTAKFAEFTAGNASKIKSVAKGIFSIFSLLGKAVGVVAKAIIALVKSDGFASLMNLIADITVGIANFFTSVNEGFDTGGLSGGLSNLVKVISDLLSGATGGIRTLGDAFGAIGRTIVKVAGWLWNGLVKGFEWITKNFSAGDIFAGLAGGGLFLVFSKLAGLFGKLKGIVGELSGNRGIIGLLFGGGDGDGSSIKEQFCGILEAANGSLQSFTTGIRIGSLVAVAVAVGILSAALTSISKLKVPDITKSLLAIGGLLTMLCASFSSMSKALSKFDAKGIVKSSFALILVSTALNILASAMVKLSGLSFPEIVKGLVGVGGGLVILTKGLKAIGGTKISLSTSVAMLALAESCKILGDAMKKFADMDWGEIARGLTGMGGALTEVVVAMSVLNKFAGGKSIAGSVGILITVQSLSKMAKSLKKFGQIQWDEIGRGLTAMGGALTEITVVTSVLSKVSGFSSLFASGAILIVVQGLGEMADALKKFGKMTWDEITRGLTGMGSALVEVAGMTGALSKISGFSSLFGAGAILIAIQGLLEMADALKKFGGMSWDEIGRGLTAMGGALTEVAGMTGALGSIAGFSGILGSGAILIAIQGLGDLADAMKKFGELSWGEILRGLVGMGAALAEIGVLTGVLGTIAGLPALLGSGAILLAVQGLGELADAMQKFGEMSWGEIGKGLAAMGAALLELAVGGLANTIAIIGAGAIATMAEPLGTLADSVMKWKDVKVPLTLGMQLSTLAYGISAFTFGGYGAMAIATLAEPLGTLAGSVLKWKGVSVPDGIGAELSKLSDGIKAFTWAGWGASAIADLGKPLGDLADSVRKWSNISVPSNLGEQLSKVASGVQAFTWAFMGGWSIDAVAKPMGDLADAVSKWRGVSVPKNLEKDLKSLSSAVQSFTLAFAGGWSIGAVEKPLGDLAGAVKKWNGVAIPSDMGSKLKGIASGVKAFSGVGLITTGVAGVVTLAAAVPKLSTVNYSVIAPGLKSLASALKTLAKTDVSGLKNLKSVGKYVNSAVDAIKKAKSNFSKAGLNLVEAVAKGMEGGKARFGTAANTICNTISKSISSKSSQVSKAGSQTMDKFVKGINSKKNEVTKAAGNIGSAAATALRGKHTNFYNAGKYLASGFAAGINDNSFQAVAKAKAMAKAAEEAVRKALKINSPSKVFRKIGTSIPEGFAQGIGKFGGMIKDETIYMADVAIGSVKSSIARLANAVNKELNTQPTIRPVLDLSAVSAGASSINGMFLNPSIGVLSNVGAISTMMNSRQNGNEDVVDAINKLNKALSNLPTGTVNNINGLTYQDGTEIADAINVLVRKTVIEGRV